LYIYYISTLVASNHPATTSNNGFDAKPGREKQDADSNTVVAALNSIALPIRLEAEML
jgi:hypothetical protein